MRETQMQNPTEATEKIRTQEGIRAAFDRLCRRESRKMRDVAAAPVFLAIGGIGLVLVAAVVLLAWGAWHLLRKLRDKDGR